MHQQSYAPFVECAKLFSAAGAYECACAFDLLGYYAACLVEWSQKTDATAGRLEAIYDLGNNLDHRAMRRGKRLAESQFVLRRCLDESIGEASQRDVACRALGALARQSMIARDFDVACQLLSESVRIARPGTGKDLCERLALSYTAMRARRSDADDLLSEAVTAFDRVSSVNDRYLAHIFFRQGINCFIKDDPSCIELFEYAEEHYRLATEQLDISRYFRGLLATSRSVAEQVYGQHVHGSNRLDRDLGVYALSEQGRILLAGDSPLPFSLGHEAQCSADSVPVSDGRRHHLIHSPAVGPVVTDALKEMRSYGQRACSCAITLLPLAAETWSRVLRQSKDIGWQNKYLNPLRDSLVGDVPKLVVRRAAVKLPAEIIRQHPSETMKITRWLCKMALTSAA